MGITEEAREDIDKKSRLVGLISVGVTWVDGRVIFKPTSKYSRVYYGICHFSKRVAFMTPIDWEKATMLSTIMLSFDSNYCEKALVCLNFGCPFNRFDRKCFAKEFECGPYSLGFSRSLGQRTLWLHEGKWVKAFARFIMPPEGGAIQYSEEKHKEYLKSKNIEEV